MFADHANNRIHKPAVIYKLSYIQVISNWYRYACHPIAYL